MRNATVKKITTEDYKTLVIELSIEDTNFVEVGKYSKTLLNAGTLKDGINLFCEDITGSIETLRKGKSESVHKFPVTMKLFTKDGRKIGNAEVIGHDGKYNIIKTDFGNTARLNDNEIKEMFHIK